MGRSRVALSDADAQTIAFELVELAAAGATDWQIASHLLGPVMDRHGGDGALAVIAVTVRALAGFLHLARHHVNQP